MHIVVGSGAVGLGLKAIFSSHRQDVVVLKRGESLFAVRDAFRSSHCRIFWIATKAFDLQQATLEVVASAQPGDAIILLSNGYHRLFADSTQRLYPEIDVRMGSVFFGSRFPDENASSVVLSNLKPGCLAIEDKKFQKISLQLEEVCFCSGIEKILREKWLMNTVINSLCGAWRLARNGLLVQYPDLVEIAFNESFDLGREVFGEWKTDKDLLKSKVWELIEASSDNENSMARDVRLRRRTETDYFAGLAVGRVNYGFLKMLHGVLA